MALAADDELLAGLRRRDERVFAAVVRAWSPAMQRVAGYYVGSRASAEDVVQQAWLAVISGLDGFEGRSSVRTWVLRICANIGRRHGAREARVAPSGLPGEESVEARRFRVPGTEWAGHWTVAGAPAPWGPEARLLTAEVRAILTDGLRRLPGRQAQVVALRDVEGLATEEIASLLDISDANVRVLLHRGRTALRAALEEYHSGTSAVAR